ARRRVRGRKAAGMDRKARRDTILFWARWTACGSAHASRVRGRIKAETRSGDPPELLRRAAPARPTESLTSAWRISLPAKPDDSSLAILAYPKQAPRVLTSMPAIYEMGSNLRPHVPSAIPASRSPRDALHRVHRPDESCANGPTSRRAGS